MTNEAFARVKIDALLSAQGWDTLDMSAVRFEVQLPDGTRADDVLCDRHGRSLAVIEANRYSVNPGDAARRPWPTPSNLVCLTPSCATATRCCSGRGSARPIRGALKTIFKQDDLERRIATLSVRRERASVPADRSIGERDYQIESARADPAQAGLDFCRPRS